MWRQGSDSDDDDVDDERNEHDNSKDKESSQPTSNSSLNATGLEEQFEKLGGNWTSPFQSFLNAKKRQPPKERNLTPLEKKTRFPQLNILKDSSIESFANYIKTNGCKKIIFMTGAGKCCITILKL